MVPGQYVKLPKDSQILAVQFQDHESLCLWALVEPTLPEEETFIEIYGTGHEVSHEYEREYIATAQADGFVWHIFRRLL
jgi:hypothetical protein